MVTKEQLKDWLDESARQAYEAKLERYIDRTIKENALRGNTTFNISTGKYTLDGSRKTDFYDLWYTEELSEENREIVHQRVLDKYKAFGFKVSTFNKDCGYGHTYFAIQFSDIDELIKH